MSEVLSSAPATGLVGGEKRYRARSVALATLLFVLFLTFLDNTIVTVVLANVQSELHASVSQLQWVVNGYALTFASLMLRSGTCTPVHENAHGPWASGPPCPAWAWPWAR